MTRLDPELKRLLSWARGAAPTPVEKSAPLGFSSRVAANYLRPMRSSLLVELQQTAWGISCVAVAVLLCGLALMFNHAKAPEPVAPVTSALSFLAKHLQQ